MQLLKISVTSFILILLFYQNSFTQIDTLNQESKIFGIYVMSGLASYNIDDLSEARDKGIKQLNFPAEVTDDYPNNPLISAELTLLRERIEIGIGLNWISTGTRVHYADYSGEYKYENIVNNFEYTLILKSRKRNLTPFNFQLALELGKKTITVKTKETLRILDQSKVNSDTFNYSTWIIKAGGRLSYHFSDWEVFIGALYCLEPQNEITLKFSGIRAIAGVGFRI